MNIEQVDRMLNQFYEGGQKSVFYPLLAERLKGYPEPIIAFAEEGLFFEERYLKIRQHMWNHNVSGKVLDIGCQVGFQSELFVDEGHYRGVDVYGGHFFNQEHPNVSYEVGCFPSGISSNLAEYVVVASMSLGYFDIAKTANEKLPPQHPDYVDVLVDALSVCQHLYISTTPELLDRLKEVFPHHELLNESVLTVYRKEHRYDMYYFSRQTS